MDRYRIVPPLAGFSSAQQPPIVPLVLVVAGNRWPGLPAELPTKLMKPFEEILYRLYCRP